MAQNIKDGNCRSAEDRDQGQSQQKQWGFQVIYGLSDQLDTRTKARGVFKGTSVSLAGEGQHITVWQTDDGEVNCVSLPMLVTQKAEIQRDWWTSPIHRLELLYNLTKHQFNVYTILDTNLKEPRGEDCLGRYEFWRSWGTLIVLAHAQVLSHLQHSEIHGDGYVTLSSDIFLWRIMDTSSNQSWHSTFLHSSRDPVQITVSVFMSLWIASFSLAVQCQTQNRWSRCES